MRNLSLSKVLTWGAVVLWGLAAGAALFIYTH